MKEKITLKLLVLLFFTTSFVNAQEKSLNIDKCFTDTYNASLLETHPNMMGSETFRQQLNTKIEALNNNATHRNQNRVVITIPLVVHVLHNGEPIGSGPNITDAQVISQVTVLNEDYRMMTGTPGESTVGGVDVEVEFVLAQRTPDGCPTNGINRVNICQDGTNQSDVQYWKTQTSWDPSSYMNMWSSKYVGDLNGILGYAQFPGGPGNTDGVSSSYNYFGSSDYDDGTFQLSPPFDKGRTMTHEVGHYLGLYHTFQGGCTVPGDEVDDTPAVDEPNYGCPTGHTSCGTIDMIENYMDYTDDACMNTFTQGQKDRVQAVLATFTNRSTLATSNGADPLPDVATDAAVEIENTNISCGTEVNPIIKITNWGTSTLTSATITYDIDGGTSSTYNWTGSLAAGASELVSLETLTPTTGSHDLNVSITASGDARACNNDSTTCFTLTGTAGPCTSIGNETDGYFTGVTGVSFNTISNLNNQPFGDVGYSDFTSLSTDVNQESSYDLTVYVDTDGDYPVGTMVWIDWNQNCSFNDPGEEYNLGVAQNVSNGQPDGSPLSITIPNSAVLGNTIMRVATQWNAFPTSCANDHDAEVEDYTINVLSSLSVEDFTLDNVSIYPNPTSNVLNIKTTNSNLPDNYAIYNMLGQVISKKVISSENDLTINTSNLSNGMYFIKISKGANEATLRFMKK
ncbi:M43 family zinc metalloprotease [Mangrovimonas spongiae]|uniref:T9SS C-terminal target domain-containing protein n=1 Tax=Mangrovimonas spongiae TaxID=2494697 RepID=A0A428K023_9FLAO|nr:M43 family zinc metalloprotease [Mangrovimonas spongiae]RSK39696.1 T9SS C-terminal target domain-containing protein [Mangrovimonas spongiae]